MAGPTSRSRTRLDPEERRGSIAAAAVRVASRDGIAGVTFREVAREADVSAALVQHYFGTRDQLILGLVDRLSLEMSTRFESRIATLGDDAPLIERLRVIAHAFIPADDDSRAAMITYHSVGAAGLTDPTLRGPDAHHNATLLIDLVAGLVAAGQTTGELDESLTPVAEARLLVAALIGLSSSVLLEHTTPAQALDTIDEHLARLQ